MFKLLALSFGIIATSVLAFSDPKLAYSLKEKGEAVIIDVREKDELKQGMIKGALWFPLSRVQTDKNWQQDFKQMVRDQQIFLYCRSGRRVEKFKTALSKENLAEAKNLGGFADLSKILPIVIP